jgi:hypothetical protein
MGEPDNGYGNQRCWRCSIGNGQSGFRSSHCIGSNGNWRPSSRSDPDNGHGNQCSGRYSFGEDAGQQGTGPSVGFALLEYGSNLDAAPPPSASGARASGGPGQWAIPTTGTGIISAPGAPTFGGPGQWASPTTGTGISSVSFAQPGTGSQCGNASGTTSTGGPGHGASPTSAARPSRN